MSRLFRVREQAGSVCQATGCNLRVQVDRLDICTLPGKCDGGERSKGKGVRKRKGWQHERCDVFCTRQAPTFLPCWLRSGGQSKVLWAPSSTHVVRYCESTVSYQASTRCNVTVTTIAFHTALST